MLAAPLAVVFRGCSRLTVLPIGPVLLVGRRHLPGRPGLTLVCIPDVYLSPITQLVGPVDDHTLAGAQPGADLNAIAIGHSKFYVSHRDCAVCIDNIGE